MIEEYILQAPKEHQVYLWKMYQLIKEEFPDAQERLTYGMPTFHWKQNAVHFSDNKRHLGFYPTPSVISAFSEELKDYSYSKGAVQFRYNQPLDESFIRKMLIWRKKELQQL